METRHAVQGSFGNEFPSIYNQLIIANLWRDIFQNSVPKGFMATPIDVLCSTFVKFGWRKSVKSCTRWTLENESNIQLESCFEPKVLRNTCNRRGFRYSLGPFRVESLFND